MADNEDFQIGLLFETEEDREDIRIALASLAELHEEKANLGKKMQDESIQKLREMTNINNRFNELDALKTMVYIRSKGHIYIELRDDSRASAAPHERRWGAYYCVLCKLQIYGRCELYHHLTADSHRRNFDIANLTLLRPGAFPYCDGVQLFQYDPLHLEEGLDVGTVLCCNLPHCQADVNSVPPNSDPARFPYYPRNVLMVNHNLRAVFDMCVKTTAKVSTNHPQNISSIMCSSMTNNAAGVAAATEYSEYSLLTLVNTGNQECVLCKRLMKGLHVSTLMDMRTGALACLGQEFHRFHTSCLMLWILWKEYSFLTKHDPDVRNIFRGSESTASCPSCSLDMTQQRERIRQAHRYWLNQVLVDNEIFENCSMGLRFSNPQEPQKDLPVNLVRFYRVAGDEWH